MDTSNVIEGTVKFRDGKKWKSRWCVVRKLSPVADCVHLQLYRDSKERYKQGQTKASLSLENFLGIQSGFTLDKESNTLAIICQEVVVILAFDTREHLMQWQVKITTNLGEGDQFLVQVSSAPPKTKLSPGPARLLIQEFQFCLTVGVPPRLIAFWKIRQLRRFGVVEGKFCFEGGSQCGRGEGLYVLVTEKPEELTKAFHLAADGKLFTRRRTVARNMSVMEKPRKSFRPDSRLSDVSSLDSVLESPQGSGTTRNPCCDCSTSREDLLSWPKSPSVDRGDVVSTSDSLKYDLKSLWTPETGLGRCTSCMGKIGSMSRSSTLTATPCSRFPAWTMDRPKSCGSQNISRSVTCSSMSLSSHSSKGSSCGHKDPHHRTSPVGQCCSTPMWLSNGNRSSTSSTTCQTPPSRPPKPPHLSFHREHTPGSTELPSSPSSTTPVKSPLCCCNHQVPTINSPYGNYDVPKSLTVAKQNLKLELKEVPFCVRPESQSSSDEYYDTPRRLKDSLIWEYGNYDIPPPAQPVPSPGQLMEEDLVVTLKSENGMGNDVNSNESESILNKEGACRNSPPIFHINKVKLTGEGRMPVMSPCGKIIEKPEPTYEEKLECLLEDEKLVADSVCNNYENIETIDDSCKSLERRLTNDEKQESNCSDSNQNYSNISMLQSIENYENFKPLFSEQCSGSEINRHFNNMDEVIENEKLFSEANRDPESNCCSNCVCSKLHKSKESILKQQNISNCQCKVNSGRIPNMNSESTSFLGAKCNSTSCLHEIKLDSTCSEDQRDSPVVNSGERLFLHCSVSASNSPSLKRMTRPPTIEQTITTQMEQVCLRQRSNSADSSRICLEGRLLNETLLTDFQRKPNVVASTPSSTNSMYVKGNQTDVIKCEVNQDIDANKSKLKLAPLVISEFSNHREQLSPNISTRYSDFLGAKRSSSVPNKFFSNRDSSSSNDSGVSTGSLSLRQSGTDFLEFEMPLTTSKSSKRHHIAMLNNTTSIDSSESWQRISQKRSKSVDPLRSLTFTFGSDDQQTGRSASAEAEVPVFLQENTRKGYVSPQSRVFLSDSRSTSSGTSDTSDYYETFSFSSFSSLDAAADNFRFGRTAPTMKPRAGKEYQKINRNLLDQETKP